MSPLTVELHELRSATPQRVGPLGDADQARVAGFARSRVGALRGLVIRAPYIGALIPEGIGTTTLSAAWPARKSSKSTAGCGSRRHQ